jgi:hypothetical protein
MGYPSEDKNRISLFRQDGRSSRLPICIYINSVLLHVYMGIKCVTPFWGKNTTKLQNSQSVPLRCYTNYLSYSSCFAIQLQIYLHICKGYVPETIPHKNYAVIWIIVESWFDTWQREEAPPPPKTSILAVRQLGHEEDHSPSRTDKVKNEWHYNSSPSYPFMENRRDIIIIYFSISFKPVTQPQNMDTVRFTFTSHTQHLLWWHATAKHTGTFIDGDVLDNYYKFKT